LDVSLGKVAMGIYSCAVPSVCLLFYTVSPSPLSLPPSLPLSPYLPSPFPFLSTAITGSSRFNPSGEFLAVGSDDGCVDVYGVTLPQGVGSRVGYCKGLSGGVTHIDWSEDSKFIQVRVASSIRACLYVSRWVHAVYMLPLSHWCVRECSVVVCSQGWWDKDGATEWTLPAVPWHPL